ncbi:MAG TPA: geranylgeranylglyceryl/heptaprenylglyceryl phosphate synthase [Salegentibacter sp.]|nr:geranylgeranylglyceryl/heptaprenylglyceryl phosphate synthase [Salegentibacter sp.]
MRNFYAEISQVTNDGGKLLAILIDPDKFNEAEATSYLKKIPKETTHIFVGGSIVEKLKTEETVKSIKNVTNLPVILFPGDYSQITETADALLFLSLLSGRNPEYLIEQQVKSVDKLKNSKLEIIPTAYILIDGGKECAVQRVSGTMPISQRAVETVVNTALAGEFSGKKLIYLEAGSGADFPVSEEIISEVKKAINIPLIVGGGIRSLAQQESAYNAGADMIVMGNHFEN